MAESVIPVEGVAYSAAAFDDLIEALGVKGDAATQGVFRTAPGVNTLAVTGTSSPVAVASGWALVKGKLYKNTASVNVAVATPAANPRIDRIVLRLDFTATPMTCTIQRLAGSEAASPTAPALTQTDGTTWEISLAQVAITTGGVITVTDERAYVGDGHVATASLANNAATDAKIRQSAGLSVIGRSANSTGNVADITAASDGQVLRRSGTSVGFGTVATAGVADDAVDDTKAGSRVPQFYRRQGGDASDWSVQGTTSRTPGAVRMQAGVIRWTGGAALSGTLDVTFPTAFSNKPIGFACSLAGQYIIAEVTLTSTTTLSIGWSVGYGTATQTVLDFSWLAIGPE